MDVMLSPFGGRNPHSAHASRGAAIGLSLAGATSLALWVGLAQVARWAAHSIF